MALCEVAERRHADDGQRPRPARPLDRAALEWCEVDECQGHVQGGGARESDRDCAAKRRAYRMYARARMAYRSRQYPGGRSPSRRCDRLLHTTGSGRGDPAPAARHDRVFRRHVSR